MKRLLILTLVLACSTMLYATPSRAAEEPVYVRVTDPYLELHTGPASEFPIFYVAERGERVEILMRRTDWFKVRIERGKEGWVGREQMEHTLTDAGVPTSFRDVLLQDYLRRRLYAGVGYGRLSGSELVEKEPITKVFVGYQLSENFAVEVTRFEAVGTFSTTDSTHINLLGSPVTDSRWVPFFTLGIGPFRNTPKATLVNAPTTHGTAGNAGVGVQYYMTRNFVARVDFREYVAPLTENRAEKVQEWSLSLSVFF